jgi:hypothetical protein
MLLVGVLLALLTAMGSFAASAEEAGEEVPLILVADTVLGTEGIPEAEIPQEVCVLSSRFKPGQQIVWRVRVYDPKTAEPLNDTTLDAVEVILPGEEVLAARYGPHPPPPQEATDFFWSTSWVIPENHPTGSLPYTIRAKAKDGRSGEFVQFNVAPSLLVILPAG